MNSLEKFHASAFNHIVQEWLPDGSVLLTFKRDNEPLVYKLHIKDLYGENEEVLKEEVNAK